MACQKLGRLCRLIRLRMGWQGLRSRLRRRRWDDKSEETNTAREMEPGNPDSSSIRMEQISRDIIVSRCKPRGDSMVNRKGESSSQSMQSVTFPQSFLGNFRTDCQLLAAVGSRAKCGSRYRRRLRRATSSRIHSALVNTTHVNIILDPSIN